MIICGEDVAAGGLGSGACADKDLWCMYRSLRKLGVLFGVHINKVLLIIGNSPIKKKTGHEI